MEEAEHYLIMNGFTKVNHLDLLKVTAKAFYDRRFFLTKDSFGLHISGMGFTLPMWKQLVEALGNNCICQLKVLYLARNKFNSFEVNNLPYLTFLNIAQNELLTRLHINNTPQLTAVHASRCEQLRGFTMTGRFNKLEKLEIYGGKLKELQLPPLPRLRYFHFAHNQISDLSPIAAHLLTPDLLFFLKGNPLSKAILDAYNKDINGFLEYLRSIQKPEKVLPLNECKVIFVGLGSSGKTSLMRRLYDNSYQKGEPETHGINKLNKKIGDIRVNFWDFGGQYIQHSLHQFFFTEKTLYILVLDRRKGEKPEYWLEQIESLGKDSPIMVVFNKVDTVQDYKEEKTKEIQDKYRNIVGFYYLSCETEYRFDTFIQDFHQTILYPAKKGSN
jgi:internalin A